MKRTLAAILGLALALSAGAQSRNFQLGKFVEIQNAILKELNRSYVDSLPVERMQKAAIDAMLGALDPYTVYVPAEEDEDFRLQIEKSYGGIGAIIFKPEKEGNVVINEPYAGSPCAKAGLVCGDEILEIDGESVVGKDAGECSSRMKGQPGTEVKFRVKKLRSRDTVDVYVTREKIHIPDIDYAAMLDDGSTGYIAQSGFTEGVADQLRSEILKLKRQGMKKLVLDLRGNGGGLLQEAVSIVSLFVPRGSVVVTARGRDPKDVVTYKTYKEPLDLKLPLVVLVDSGSGDCGRSPSGYGQGDHHGPAHLRKGTCAVHQASALRRASEDYDRQILHSVGTLRPGHRLQQPQCGRKCGAHSGFPDPRVLHLPRQGSQGWRRNYS